MFRFIRCCLLLLFCLFFYGCNPLPLELKTAEQIMEAAPDSALRILRQINEKKISGASNRALYALLFSQALDKNDIKSESDSLISIATDYYNDADPVHAGYAWLYRARIANNRDSINEQANCLLRAQEFAASTVNDKLKGLIYIDEGLIFRNQLQHDSCIRYLKLAYNSFSSIADNRNRILGLLNIGYSFLYLSRLDSATYYYLLSEKIALNSKDIVLLSVILKNLGTAYLQQNNYRQALKYYQRVPSSNVSIYEYNKYYLIANTYVKLNQLDSAVVYLKKIHDLSDMAPDYYRLWQAIYERKGMASKAIYYANKKSIATDSIYKRKLETSFAGLDKKYRFQGLQIQNQKLIIKNKQNEFLLLISLLFITLITMAILLVLFLSKRKEAQYQKELAERKQELLEKEQENVIKEKHNNFLLERQLKLQSILLSNIKMHKTNTVKRPHIWCEGSKEMIEQQQYTFCNELLTYVDMEFNNFTVRLKERHPALSDRDIFFSCLILSGFETGMIATILSVQAESINKQRYRLRIKLKLLNSDKLYDYLLHF